MARKHARSGVRKWIALLAALAATLACSSQAVATSFTPGDVVVYRVGNGTEGLSSSAAAAFLNEYDANGSLPLTLAFPTSNSGATKRLVAGGSASSEGLLTLSGNGEFLLAAGYNAAVGTPKPDETKAKEFTRTIARVSAAGTIDTTTSLEDFADANNARSATSFDGTTFWVGGAGKSPSGGVRFVSKPGEKKSKQTSEAASNVRQVAVVGGQLYASADPSKNTPSFALAKIGSGLPATEKQPVTSLPFAVSPEQPFAFSMLTLGLGSTPDTIYVAECVTCSTKPPTGVSQIGKYGLTGGQWVKDGSVEIPFVTGVTANDVNGVVTIYATSSGAQSTGGTLYKLSDVSGPNGILSGVPVEIATAPANEAFRGVAFAPGTAIGSGGVAPPAPTISAAENTLAAALGDPTNNTMPITVGDSTYALSELTVKVTSSNPAVASPGGISVAGTGANRIMTVTPGTFGTAKLTITVEAPDGAFTSTQVSYGVSENQGSPSDRYYAGAGNASTAIDVGGGYTILGDDETNVLRLYRTRTSGEPVRTFDFTNVLPAHSTEMDIEASARVGNTIYWLGSLANKHNGEAQPARDIVFATTVTGSGANTELTYVGSYTHLREDIVEWDIANGNPLGLAASAESGARSDLASGFNVEGLEFAAGSTSEAYVAFRAPLEPPGEGRHLALLVPVANFSSLVSNGNPGSVKATFGTALQWNLGGLAIREIRKNADGEYLVLAGTAEGSDTSFGLYGWDGEPEDEPVQLITPTISQVAEGAWESITTTPDPIANGNEVELIEDNGDTPWYDFLTTSKNGLQPGLQKDLGRLYSVQIPPPGTPAAPVVKSGGNPNKGNFTLHWKPAPTLRPIFTLQHQNAQGGWTTVASGLTHREYSFSGVGHESEGTWTYRVKEQNESGESGYSAASEEVKVDRTSPNAPLANASRGPDYAGGGGWYKDHVTVTFSANGDPALADGSPGSGVEPASLSAPETLEASGSDTASGTIADNAGNVSAPGTLTLQVDATAPTVEISCPAIALVGEAGVTATVSASDGQSGLASDPSGVVALDTSQPGPTTVTRTASDHVGHQTTSSCTTEVRYETPGAPTLSAGSNPNGTGAFALAWTGDAPLQFIGLAYKLQHHNAATASWTTVATGLEALQYEFSVSPEPEGTWVYRVQGSDPGRGQTTEYSPDSSPVVVDESAPFPPSAIASRKADYAGGGGWYADNAEVSFGRLGDPALSDGSPGSGIDPSSIAPAQTFTTTGSHSACGTVADNAGNVSAPGCLTVQVDATAPAAPTAAASRAPDYAGGGGWYKDGVEVSFAANGDAGSGLKPGTLSPPEAFETSGAHTACGTDEDNVGHLSSPGCLAVQVDATAPSLEVECPAEVTEGATGVHATVKATDSESGLASDPSGVVPIATASAGPVTVTRTAVDHVGHETTTSCTTEVGFTSIFAGTLTHKLVVPSGQAIELTSTAVALKGVVVEGGALDIEGATVKGSLHGNAPTLLRICGAKIEAATKVARASGTVVIGDPGHGCAADTLTKTAGLSSNHAGVTLNGDVFGAALKVTENAGGATVMNNKIAGGLTVTGNTGTVVDKPNEVKGKSKLQ